MWTSSSGCSVTSAPPENQHGVGMEARVPAGTPGVPSWWTSSVLEAEGGSAGGGSAVRRRGNTLRVFTVDQVWLLTRFCVSLLTRRRLQTSKLPELLLQPAACGLWSAHLHLSNVSFITPDDSASLKTAGFIRLFKSFLLIPEPNFQLWVHLLKSDFNTLFYCIILYILSFFILFSYTCCFNVVIIVFQIFCFKSICKREIK